MKQKVLKIVSIVLCLCFVFGTVSVCAETTKPIQITTDNFVEKKSEDTGKGELRSKYELGTSELKDAELSKEEIPELVTQEQIEEKGHVNRLYDLEDENSVVFQNKDGSETLYTFADPVQYKDSKGELKDKKRTLKEDKSGKYAYEVTTNDVKSYFPEEMSTEEGIVVEDAQAKITMKPLYSQEKNNELEGYARNSSKKEANKSSAKKISKKKNDNDCNGIDYEGMFGEGTKVRYTPTYTGVKEDIIIDSPECNNRYSFEVDTEDLVAVKEDGYINFLNPLTGEKEAEISPVYIYDSAEIPNSSTEGYYELEEKSDGKYIVTLVADEEFLNAESTVYPVYLDPSLNLSFNVSVIKDAIFYKGTNTFNETTAEGTIGRRADSHGRGRMLISFPKLDTNNATYKAITDESKIKKAELKLYMYGQTNASSIRPVLYSYDWVNMLENDCSNGMYPEWDGYTALSDMTATSVGNTSTAQQYTFNVTAAVKKWKSQSFYNPKKGLMLKVINDYETNTNYRKQVYTANKSGFKPSFSITYNRNLTLSATNVTINEENSSPKLIATLQPETDSTDLTFVSSDPSVVSVSGRTNSISSQVVKSTVMLEPVGRGTATITVSSVKNPSWVKTCAVTVAFEGVLHYTNIDSVRFNKYDMSDYGGDSIISTSVAVLKNDLGTYFECAAYGKEDYCVKITSSLISELTNINVEYESNPTLNTQGDAVHRAKLLVDYLVTEDIIDNESSEYYGIWSMEANRWITSFNNSLELIALTTAVITVATSIYGAITSYKFNSMSYNTTTTISPSQYKSFFDEADDLVSVMTHNPNSNKVLLGSSYDGEPYNVVANNEGMTYFYSSNYDSLKNQYGSDYMWRINKSFILKQKNAGKEFWFSHNPMTAYSESSFKKEVDLIKEIFNAVDTDFVKVGSLWKLNK